MSFGSVCSGIEAASIVLEPLGFKPLWFSEIADFPASFLKHKHPRIPNLGDMNDIPSLLQKGLIEAPDFLCGGTPCQAFSLAGWQNGLNDNRGLLTLKYIEIINEIDKRRIQQGKDNAIFFWENVEGVLKDRTNAFGYFLAGLAGVDTPIKVGKWPSAGVIHGPKRNIAWRILDGKYLGLPQQRKRLYVLGGGTSYYPENVLFELGEKIPDPYKILEKNSELDLFSGSEKTDNSLKQLRRVINGNEIEIFRIYTDCLYAAYGTKWNGNAAAYNGSLFVSQNNRLRRLTPLECERLMGFPDNYTLIPGCKDTTRYQAVGNSWAIPVIKWIADRVTNFQDKKILNTLSPINSGDVKTYLLQDFTYIDQNQYINASSYVYDHKLKNLLDIIDINANEKFYISPQGCAGILRRKKEKNMRMNQRLEEVLSHCSQDYTIFQLQA